MDRRLSLNIFKVAIAVVGLAIASHVEVPLRPVPLTLQSLAVVLAGFFLGPFLAFLAATAWLLAGAVGLPVFSGGAGGLEHLTGATAGYLLSFPLAAALAGAMGSRRSFVWWLAAAIAAHLLILVAGTAWLATQIGVRAAIDGGFLPFLLGVLIKSLLAAGLMKVVAARRRGEG